MSIFASNSVRQTFWFGNLSANLESRNFSEFSEFSKTELSVNVAFDVDKTKFEHKNSGKLVRVFFSDFSDFLPYFST